MKYNLVLKLGGDSNKHSNLGEEGVRGVVSKTKLCKTLQNGDLGSPKLWLNQELFSN